MALGGTIKNAVGELAGKAKEATSRATHNVSLEAEGRTDQAAAKVKRTGEDAKDVFR